MRPAELLARSFALQHSTRPLDRLRKRRIDRQIARTGQSAVLRGWFGERG